MKTIKLFSGKEYLIEDNEFEIVKNLIRNSKMIELSNGDIFNSAAIEYAGELDKMRFWDIYPIITNKAGTFFIREGEQIFLEARNFDEIKIKDDLKYLSMNKVKLLKK